MILDAGPLSVADVVLKLDTVKTLVWNGPFGAFELPPFDTATVTVAKAAAKRVKAGQLVAVAGGGDTVAAMNHAGVADDLTYRLDRGRRLPRMDGRQGAAGRRGAAAGLTATGDCPCGSVCLCYVLAMSENVQTAMYRDPEEASGRNGILQSRDE